MTHTLLRWHLWAWCLLTPALAALLVLALLHRPALPAAQALPPGWLQPLAPGR